MKAAKLFFVTRHVSDPNRHGVGWIKVPEHLAHDIANQIHYKGQDAIDDSQDCLRGPGSTYYPLGHYAAKGHDVTIMFEHIECESVNGNFILHGK